jgi:uncharacterized protein (TIGR00106 family)
MLVQLTMFPSGRSSESASKEVAKVIDIIDKSGLPYRLGPMSTTIEGSWEKVMATINKARLMLRRNHNRIYISITIDDRKEARGRIDGKIESIQKKLGRKVRT